MPAAPSGNLFAESAGCGEKPAQYGERAEDERYDRGNDARPAPAELAEWPNEVLAETGEPVYN